MPLVEINWNPNQRELRQFGASMIVGFGLFAAMADYIWNQPKLALVFLAVGVVTGVAGLSGFRPVAMLVYRPWMAFAFVMGSIMSRIFVAAFYFLLITPMGLVMRLIGSDPLQRKNVRTSYWVDLPATTDRAKYERQY
jgi:Saxitoxin biosynthesis operon protein SxtJ